MKPSRPLRRAALLALMAALAVLTALPAAALSAAQEPEVPTVAAFAKNGTTTDVFTFSPSDFVVGSGDVELDSILLTSLPDSNAGVLSMAGKDLAVGEAVALSAVSGMRFTPNASHFYHVPAQNGAA